MTHVQALDLERVPAHLVVIGGGYVGLELAQAMRRFGSRVTVIERGSQLAEPRGSRCRVRAFRTFSGRRHRGPAECHIPACRGTIRRAGSRECRRCQRRPRDRGDGSAGRRRPDAEHPWHRSSTLPASSSTHAATSWSMSVSKPRLPNVWAMGDCAGSPQFTHVAFDDFRIVRDNLTGGVARRAIVWSRSACSPIPNWRASD